MGVSPATYMLKHACNVDTSYSLRIQPSLVAPAPEKHFQSGKEWLICLEQFIGLQGILIHISPNKALY